MDSRFIDVVQGLGAIATAGGVAFAAYQMRRENEWRKKQQALQMIAEWNRNTASHRLAIDHAYPGLLDESGTHGRSVLTADDAQALHDAVPSRKGGKCDGQVVLRGHFVELLNYCEYVSVTALEEAADHGMVAVSLRDALHRWFHALEPFIRHVGSHRHTGHPWKPFERYVRSACGGAGCPFALPYEEQRKRVEAELLLERRKGDLQAQASSSAPVVSEDAEVGPTPRVAAGRTTPSRDEQ